jgi:mRNA interferase RelE/StbE
MRRLDVHSDAIKFLDRLDAKQYRQVVRKVFQLLDDPRPNDSIQMRGTDHYRANIGEYRIICRFDGETVFVIVIGKRDGGEVYRELERRGG